MTSSLNTLWNGELSPHSLEYNLSCLEDSLAFGVNFPPSAKGPPEATAGVYTPELWRWDVGELFISGEGGRYLELNLSPSGAYWIQGFSAIRTVDERFNPDSLLLSITSSQIRLSTAALESFLGDRSLWRMNVTGILNSPDYVFLSKATLSGSEADFHQPSYFTPMSLLP